MRDEQSHTKLAKGRIMSDSRYLDRWQARLLATIIVSDNFKEAEPKLREVLDDKTKQGR